MAVTLEAPQQIWEQTVDGPVTIGLVITVFSVCAVVVSITLWAVGKFQTKEEAATMEEALQAQLEKQAQDLVDSEARLKNEIQGMHTHLAKVRDEIRADSQNIWDRLTAMSTENAAVARDIAYIRGRLEPRPDKI